MTMAYSPYGAVSNIYKLKGQWDTAHNAGDENAKNTAAQSAQQYYQELRDNGYGDVADELSKSNYTQAKAIHDKWAKMGKTSTRDYLYSLGKSYGMTSGDVDNLIGWDNQTKEVSFGGKKIGTPDTIVDGVSYWSDTSVLDNAFNDYVGRSGTTLNSGVDNPAYNQSMQSATDKNNKLAEYIDSDRKDVQGKYNSIYDYANQDITKTDEYQSTFKKMMGKYDLSALQGRDNAVASGSATNGGNIDSYSAANAMRQQAVLTAQGQQIAHQAGLDAYNTRVSNVAKILNDLGVYNRGTYDAMNKTIANDSGLAQQYFDNAETAENNKTERLRKEAEVTGYTPNEWVIKNDDIYSQFLNEDGTFKAEKENVDIQALIDHYKAKGDTETATKLSVVRARKIFGNYEKFGQYANEGDLSTMKPIKTEDAKTNEAKRQDIYSGISGTVGDKVTKWLNSNIWNDDGSLVNYSTDYQASIDQLEKTLASTTDENERARIYEQLRVLEAARNQKIDEQGLPYGKTYKYQSAPPTEASQQFDATNDTNLESIRTTSADNRYLADANSADVRYQVDNKSSGWSGGGGYKVSSGSSSSSNTPSLSANQSRTAILDGEISQTVIDAYNFHFGTNYTVDNPPPISEAESADTSDKPKLTPNQVQDAVQRGEITQTVIDAYNYYYGTNYTLEDVVGPDESTESSYKPKLSATQARDAIKRGEINQGTIDAYNYYYDTNYTVENPPNLGGNTPATSNTAPKNTSTAPLSDAQVESWADSLNNEISSKYPGYTAIDKTGTNTYKKGDVDADWLIIKVFESQSLTQKQKEYLLYDKFGITESQVNSAMKDDHYRR